MMAQQGSGVRIFCYCTKLGLRVKGLNYFDNLSILSYLHYYRSWENGKINVKRTLTFLNSVSIRSVGGVKKPCPTWSVDILHTQKFIILVFSWREG